MLRFGAKVLPAGDWDPDQGTSLEDFFCVCCLPDLANRWRWHLRRLPERSAQVRTGDEDRVLTLPARAGADPAQAVESQGLVAQALASLKPVDRLAFVLLAAGWSPAEIAEKFAIGRNAFDARVSRARAAARSRRTP